MTTSNKAIFQYEPLRSVNGRIRGLYMGIRGQEGAREVGTKGTHNTAVDPTGLSLCLIRLEELGNAHEMCYEYSCQMREVQGAPNLNYV